MNLIYTFNRPMTRSWFVIQNEYASCGEQHVGKPNLFLTHASAIIDCFITWIIGIAHIDEVFDPETFPKNHKSFEAYSKLQNDFLILSNSITFMKPGHLMQSYETSLV